MHLVTWEDSSLISVAIMLVAPHSEVEYQDNQARSTVLAMGSCKSGDATDSAHIAATGGAVSDMLRQLRRRVALFAATLVKEAMHRNTIVRSSYHYVQDEHEPHDVRPYMKPTDGID